MIAKEVLIKFVEGDKVAFDKIYAAYSSGMFGICLRYTRCRDDAQDVLQDSFINYIKRVNALIQNYPLGHGSKQLQFEQH